MPFTGLLWTPPPPHSNDLHNVEFAPSVWELCRSDVWPSSHASRLSQDRNTRWVPPRIAQCITGPFRPRILPLLCPYFIQLVAFSPCKLPFRNNPEWLYVSTQKSIGLEQKPSASVNLTFIPPSPRRGIQNARQYFSSEAIVARSELICQGKLFLWLT